MVPLSSPLEVSKFQVLNLSHWSMLNWFLCRWVMVIICLLPILSSFPNTSFFSNLKFWPLDRRWRWLHSHVSGSLFYCTQACFYFQFHIVSLYYSLVSGTVMPQGSFSYSGSFVIFWHLFPSAAVNYSWLFMKYSYESRLYACVCTSAHGCLCMCTHMQ